ncbi:hypothetical protein [Burkholderia sp. Tr-20390]|uniref:hypothetical protein n=1 Tax=Burkholderia sp. Tr-20390 TaxID=2703904 RepID=UPI00198231FC|nr:hypothetical protein [Burkholderia sp. Tr-20390]MBN3730977.1 hypothetical protein [Burkholderia sp. Tr-20390]
MQEGASHLDLSGIPSIGTIAASRLDESRCVAFVVARAMRHRGWVMCRFHEAEKLEQITALSRTFLRWHFEEVLHCHGPSPRTTRDDKRPGHTRLDRQSINRPVSRWRRARTVSPSDTAAGARFAGAKNHIRNINRRQN